MYDFEIFYYCNIFLRKNVATSVGWLADLPIQEILINPSWNPLFWHPVCLVCNLNTRNCTFISDNEFSANINATSIFPTESLDFSECKLTLLENAQGLITDLQMWSTAQNGLYFFVLCLIKNKSNT